ncbi:MAG: hypothetical protein WD793_05505 [Steroidobacteraceae bacterium]
MDYLYSLYDALVSINVPSDKARAVVDAMERDMGTTLATKRDLEAQSLVTKKDLELVRSAMKQDLELLRSAMTQDLELLRSETRQGTEMLRQELRQENELLRQEMDGRFQLVDQRFDSLRSEVSRDLAAQKQSIVIQLGSLIVVCFGMTLAVMRFWI